MDGIKANDRVLRGYALAAARLGRPHSIYRPSTTTAPTSTPSLGVVQFVADANDLRFTKSRRRGEITASALWDARLTRPGDYLVGDTETWCVATQDPLLPLTAYRCDRVISITRAGPPSLGVSDVYGGEGQFPVAVLTSFPAAMTARGGGEGGVGLPGDVGGGGALVLLPAVPGVTVLVSDTLTDDLGRRWRVEGAELSASGWRLHVEGAQP